MQASIEFEDITSRRMLTDLIAEHGSVAVTQNGTVILQAHRRQMEESIFATLELVSDPKLREDILKGLEDSRQGRVRPLSEMDRRYHAR